MHRHFVRICKTSRFDVKKVGRRCSILRFFPLWIVARDSYTAFIAFGSQEIQTHVSTQHCRRNRARCKIHEKSTTFYDHARVPQNSEMTQRELAVFEKIVIAEKLIAHFVMYFSTIHASSYTDSTSVHSESGRDYCHSIIINPDRQCCMIKSWLYIKYRIWQSEAKNSARCTSNISLLHLLKQYNFILYK